MVRTIIVDGQVLQTGAKDRGMGRYTLCVLQALLARPDVAMKVILSRDLPHDNGLLTELQELLPGVEFVVLGLWSLRSRAVEAAMAHNKTELTQYIARSGLEQADYFVPSLFQDPGVAAYPDNVRCKTALFHDLIPYLYHTRYEKFMGYKDYLKRFKLIFEADLIFTNSQTVADDLNMYLGVPKQRLCRVDGAAIVFDREEEQPKLSIDRPFILFNTSDDPRKNNLRAVLGFEEYRLATKSDVLLVATSQINHAEQEKLRSITKHIVFTGNIPYQQVNWLFAHCESVLFVSESEGLGLPLLEAVAYDKKVVASAINVLREISPDDHAFYFCDQENTSSIARALEQAMAKNGSVNSAAYAEIKRYYTWANTAERMMVGLEQFQPRPAVQKPRIAVFVPVPSGLSGVGLTHAAILHPVLADNFDVDYYIEYGLSGASVRPDYLQYSANCFPASMFSVDRYRMYDAVIYHLGNGEYHLEAVKNALYLPGYIIGHDTHMTEAYRVLRETGMMPERRVELEAVLDELNDTKHSTYYTSLANRQLGILTHSHYAANAMHEVLQSDVPVVASHLATNVPDYDAARLEGRVALGLAGAIADVKGLDIIRDIARDSSFSECDIRLFGYNHASKETLDELTSFDNVSVATNVSDFDFQTSMSKLDVFVNYRMTYKGESSNTTLEAMRQGVVVMARNIGWFSELPDDVVIKLDGPEDVLVRLKQLIKHPEEIRAIGLRAKQYAAQAVTYETYVADIKRLIVAGQQHAANPNLAVAQALRSGQIQTPQQLADLRKDTSRG